MDTRQTLTALALTLAATSALAAPTRLPVVFVQPGTVLKVGDAEGFAPSLRRAMQKEAVSVGMAEDFVSGDIRQGFQQIAAASDRHDALRGRFDQEVDKPGLDTSLIGDDERRYLPVRRVRLGFYRRVEGELVHVRSLEATLYSLEYSRAGLSTAAASREIHAIYLHGAKELGDAYGILGRVAVSAYEVHVFEDELAARPGAAASVASNPFGIPLS